METENQEVTHIYIIIIHFNYIEEQRGRKN